jgi:hypothetical protein
MSIEELEELVLKRFFLVMLDLVDDVLSDNLSHGLAHGKRRVAFLPMEFARHAVGFVDPMRRVGLEMANGSAIANDG